MEGAHREQLKLLDRPAYFNVQFENASIDNSSILALGGEAIDMHERCDVLVTALSSIELVGMMQRVLEMTCQYITNRVQFGQPVAKFQAARHRAAEMLMKTETSRWAAYHALWRFRQNPSNSDGVSLAKHWAIRAAELIYQNSHMLHGGIGVGIEYPLHLYTQPIASFIVRGGNANEMTARILNSMNLRMVTRPAT